MNDELRRRLDILEVKIDTLLDNSSHVKSHINWVDRMVSMFMPSLSRMLGLKNVRKGAQGNIRGHDEADRRA